MLPVTIPSPSDLAELTEHRDDASVSIYLPSSPLPGDTSAVRLALKNATKQAVAQLEQAGYDKKEIGRVIEPLAELDHDAEFWQYQANALGVLAAPGRLHAFRLLHAVPDAVAVSDRFDVGPLLRSVALANGGYALTITEKEIHLYGLATGARPVELELQLPDDLHTVLEHAENDGQADRLRAAGATGQKIEHQRFCRIVQDAVFARIDEQHLPMILAASADMEPAYRAINTYPRLIETSLGVHPESLTPAELHTRTAEILDKYYAEELSQWREDFGTHRSQGLATSQISEVARAATAGAVAELYFDVECTEEGVIDDEGAITKAENAGAGTYGVVDEIAARVLRTGGTVKGVRNKDLVDGSPVAAVLRYPL